MRKIKITLLFSFFFLCLLSAAYPLRAQQQGMWSSLLAIHVTEDVVETPNKVFALADGVLYSIEKEDPSNVVVYDRVNGLSEMSISRIAYAEELKALILYYESGNIDVLEAGGGVTNISALKDNVDLVDKTLNRLLIDGGRAYLAGGFGLSVLDIAKGRILATYAKGSNVTDVTKLSDGRLLMLNKGSFWVGSETDNLQDPSAWSSWPLNMNIPLDKIVDFGSVGSDVYFLFDNGAVGVVSMDSLTAESFFTAEVSARLVVTSRGLFICAPSKLYMIEAGRKKTVFSVPNTLAVGAMADSQTAYLAMGEEGLASLPLSDGGAAESLSVDFDGPGDNDFYEMLAQNGRLYTVSGMWGLNLMYHPGMVKLYDGKRWTNLDKKKVETDLEQNGVFNDAVDIAVSPGNPDHFFVGTWGRGLFEFADGKALARYTAGNTVIAECNPGDARVKSIAFDRNGHLWGTLGSVEKNIFMYEPDTKIWHSFTYPEVTGTASFGNMVILSNGDKWVNILHRSGGSTRKGVLIFNDEGTPDVATDDKYRYVEQFVSRLGAPIGHKTIYAMAVDKNGAIWMGSDIGIFAVYNAGGALASSGIPVAVRPVGGEEPNLYYILDKVTVTDIVVDKLNHKWVATLGSGLYLLSEDCSEVLAHYSVDNSPLLSDNISSLALNEDDGLLYIGTAEGLMSFQTGAGMGDVANLDGIYVYPNPLRPEYPDGITISGLQAGCNVKITDITGRLLFETESVTTEVKWNARGADGNRVASGVYAVAAYDPISKKSKLVRFAVIR